MLSNLSKSAAISHLAFPGRHTAPLQAPTVKNFPLLLTPGSLPSRTTLYVLYCISVCPGRLLFSFSAVLAPHEKAAPLLQHLELL